MKRTLFSVIFICLITLSGLFVTANAATNSAFSFFDLTQTPNSRYSEHLYIYTQSTTSPETFSVSMTELPGVMGWDYDKFEIVYQTSTVTGEWTVENVWIWTDTDADNYRDSLRATLTGCDANNEVWVYAYDIYGK